MVGSVRVAVLAVVGFVATSTFAEVKPVALEQSDSAPELRPGLDPESDKKFFKKDYPDDTRPAVTGYHTKYQKKYDFTHPYPIVQEDGKYDSDFVSDENNDSGEWRAQEEYDKVRIQIAKLKAEVDRLGVKEADARNELEVAQAKEDEAEATSKSAEAQADSTKKAADNAQDHEDKLVDSAKDAEAEVRKEMRQLGDCRQELKDAKAALDKHVQKDGGKSSGAVRENKEEADIDSSAEAAEAAEAVEEKWEDKLAREKSEYQKAKERYEKEASDVKEVQLLLDKAAVKLRKFRAEGVDQDGGVYRVDENGKKIAFHHSHHQSGAVRSAGLVSFMALLVVAASAAALP